MTHQEDGMDCAHVLVETFGDGENGPSLWACADCRLRFYPACRTCVDVGHRNIEHPEPNPSHRGEERAMSEPLTAEEVEDVRIRGANLALVDPRFYSLWDVINRLLATLDFARSATPSSEEDGACGCRDFDAYPDGDSECRRCGHDASSHVQTSDDGDQMCDGVPLRNSRSATPDGAGRSSIEKEAASADAGRSPEWVALANDIRIVDGNHDLGAGALAEALTARGWTRRDLNALVTAARYPWPEHFGTREAAGWNAAFEHIAARLSEPAGSASSPLSKSTGSEEGR